MIHYKQPCLSTSQAVLDLKPPFELYSCSTIQTNNAGSAVRLDFLARDGAVLETAVLKLPHRKPTLVICAPSQVGCVFHCHFCGLRDSNHAQNLKFEEILGLITQSCLVSRRLFDEPIKGNPWQISFMGQGEPLANFTNLVRIFNHFLEEEAEILFGISTIGIPRKLCNLAELPLTLLMRIKLQLSLHAPFDSIRHELMPGTHNWTIAEMLNSAKLISIRSGRKIGLNYILIRNKNDDEKCLQALVELVDPDFFYIKISSLNSIRGSQLNPASQESVQRFANGLREAGRTVNIFSSAGGNVNAGCGQIGKLAIPVSEF